MEIKAPKAVAETPVKFSDAEIAELTEIQTGYDRVIGVHGRVFIQKREIERTEKQVVADMDALEKRERTFLDGIVKKYGEGNYDRATNTFTPAPKK